MQYDKHFVVDWLLFAICLLYFFIGLRKGFLTSIVSMVSFFVVIVLSFSLREKVATLLDGVLGGLINGGIKNGLNTAIAGKFSSTDELLFYLMSTRYGKYFGVILKSLIKNVSFEGSLTAGEIVSPTLTWLLLKVISFAALTILFSIVFKLLEMIMHKLVKMVGRNGDRLLGGMFGIFKGLLVFVAIFIVISAIANFTLSEKLLSFVNSGIISKQIYNKFIIKIINLFY